MTSQMPIPIRPAEPRDIPAITRIYAHAVRHGTASFELDPPDEAEIARRYTRAALTAAFRISWRRSTARSPDTPMPAPIARGRRIASPSRIRSTSIRRCSAAASAARCWSGCWSESEARGFRQMIAVIGNSAQTASIELHEALGFRMVGTFEAVGFKFGRWLDSVLMQKALGDGASTTP